MKIIFIIRILFIWITWIIPFVNNFPLHAQEIKGTGENEIFINIVDESHKYQYTSVMMNAGLDEAEGRFEMRIPSNSIRVLNGGDLEYFYSALNLDTVDTPILYIYIDLPEDQFNLGDFKGQENHFDGIVNFGMVEIRGEVLFNGLYDNDFLLFDFKSSIVEPMALKAILADSAIQEIEIIAKGAKIVDLID